MIRKLITTIVALSIVLTGCAADTSEDAAITTESIKESNPYGGGFTVDSPAADEIVLTVNGTTSKDYTLGELKELATTKISIFEPFLQEKQSFSVIKMQDLVSPTGIKPTDILNTLALNDYAFEDTVDNFRKNNAYIAILRNGQDIPMDQGGPIRIIFADDSKYSTYLAAWNWSIRTIEIKK